MLASTFHLGSFSIFHRSGVQEGCTFVAREILQRSRVGTIRSVKHENYLCHTRVTSEGLGTAVICDEEYPRLAAFGLIQRTIALFLDSAGDQWKTAKKDVRINVAGLDAELAKFQDPTEGDQVLKIRKELDEIQAICMQSIDQLLARDEKLERLVQES